MITSFDYTHIEEECINLISRTACKLPQDVVSALKNAQCQEKDHSLSREVINQILLNIRLASDLKRPICQDTGTPVFYVTHPLGLSQKKLREIICSAVEKATKKGFLRPNAVHPLSGSNSGNNLGFHFPVIYFSEDPGQRLWIRLMLKGGGSENASCQFSLPNADISAGRDLEGVRKVVLTALNNIQGKGCAPGILGICVGGDRQTGMKVAKEQLFRKLDDVNPNPQLSDMETRILRDSRKLAIGPMGLGGQTALLGVKMCAIHRLPASFFVSISYMCWAARRSELYFDAKNGKADEQDD